MQCRKHIATRLRRHHTRKIEVMKILTAAQTAQADALCIEEEGIDSLSLMERAAEQIALWICNNIDQQQRLLFIVGKGNNAGDGLAAARILHNAGFCAQVYTPFPAESMSEQCRANFERLPEGMLSDELYADENTVIVDALLGIGTSGPVREPVAGLIEAINNSGCRVISIDIPSGMHSEDCNDGQTIVNADTTLTIQFPKLSMMLPQAGEHCGQIEVLDIGIDCSTFETPYHYVVPQMIEASKRRRPKFAYKNMYGHALLVCGSPCMTGAAILAAGAALRSGCGLVTVHTPYSERTALQVSCPSAMLSYEPEDVFASEPRDLEKYSAIGTGCGIGTDQRTASALRHLLSKFRRPMVIDADALNIIAADKELLYMIPTGSILTPHPGELRRLTGEWSSEQEKLALASRLASRTRSTVVVKGAHSAVCTADGRIYFNSTGSSGMAKGGSGDVLTGLLTGLLACGYTSAQAAVIGVFEHGCAGEKAEEYYSSESMNSSDIIDFINL